jgi:hypothetical protein
MVARRLLVFTTRARARVCLCKPKNKQAWPCSLRASPSSWTISDRQRPSARVRTSQSQAPRQEGIHQLGLRRLTAMLGKGSSERASEPRAKTLGSKLVGENEKVAKVSARDRVELQRDRQARASSRVRTHGHATEAEHTTLWQ